MSTRTLAFLAVFLTGNITSPAQPDDRVVRNSIGMTFVQIPSGQFMMGSSAHAPQAADDEQPRHAVRITKSFYLGMFEVTQQEFKKLMDHDPSSFSQLPSGRIERRLVHLIVTRADSVNPLSASLPAKLAEEIEKLGGVSSTCAGLVDFTTIDECGSDPIGMQGWPAGNDMFGELKIIAGRNISAQDPGAKNAVVGTTLARLKSLKVGQTLTICDDKFRIVGIFESAEDLENGMVITTLGDAQKCVGKVGLMTGCTVKVKDSSPAGIAAIRTEIEGPLAEKLGIKGKVRAKTSSEFYAQVEARRDVRYPPVENVSWNDAQDFCRRLSALPAEKAAGRRYRLPSEAEWEYAARAGANEPAGKADASSDLSSAAWYAANSSSQPHPVGQKALNAWGLCDMYGNVAEWCSDGYSADYYAKSPTDDPTGPSAAETRVTRGGSWNLPASACEPAARSSAKPDAKSADVGFRVVLETKPVPDGSR